MGLGGLWLWDREPVKWLVALLPCVSPVPKKYLSALKSALSLPPPPPVSRTEKMCSESQPKLRPDPRWDPEVLGLPVGVASRDCGGMEGSRSTLN